ncbi:MAG: thymidylate synthase [Gammaproteobacteria bacterium]|nr:thymidylate synthase [Gammaproteobacteria bacterium]
MHQHLHTLAEVKYHGAEVIGRNGKTLELFGGQTKYPDVHNHFPIVTTKYLPIKVVLAELLCFINGYSDVRDFQKLGCNIWTQNAYSDYWKQSPFYKEHSLGRIYGVQWRDWRSVDPYVANNHYIKVDQLQKLVDGLIKEPYGRRHIVTAWNPGELDQMCLPPCHAFFQCNVTPDRKLNLLMYQRSCDLFIGNPFDIASYAALMLIICKLTGYTAGTLTHTMGSMHIYQEHYEAVHEQLSKVPLQYQN